MASYPWISIIRGCDATHLIPTCRGMFQQLAPAHVHILVACSNTHEIPSNSPTGYSPHALVPPHRLVLVVKSPRVLLRPLTTLRLKRLKDKRLLRSRPFEGYSRKKALHNTIADEDVRQMIADTSSKDKSTKTNKSTEPRPKKRPYDSKAAH